MNTKSLTSIHWIAIVALALICLSAAFYFTKAEATTTRVVGGISVNTFVPNADGIGEYFTLEFTGVLSRESFANLENWRVENSDNFSYDLSAVVLPSNTVVMFCEQDYTNTNCDYFWQGNNVFDDTSGELRLVSGDGSTIITIPYQNPNASQEFSGDGDYVDTIYSAGDKVGACLESKNGLKYQAMSMKRILAKDPTANTSTDIIPSFVYEERGKLDFYPGVNWPDGGDTLRAQCAG